MWLPVGIAAGVLALSVGVLPTRWALGFVAAAVFGFVGCFVQNLHRFLLAAFVLSLQANLTLRFFSQSAGSYVGHSGPTSIELPVCAVVALALLATIGVGVRTQPVRLTFPRRFILPVVGLIVAASLSIINTPERFLTFCYVTRIPVLAIVLAAAANGIRSEDDLNLVVRMFAITLVIQGIVYLIESILGVTFSLDGSLFPQNALSEVPRHGGTVSSRSNPFATFILPLLLVTIARLLADAHPRANKSLAAVILIGTATLIGTFARAAWAGFALGFLYLLFAGTRHRLIDPKSLIMLLASLAIPILALWGLIAIRLGADHLAAYEERAALIRMGTAVFQHYPAFGCGAGAYAFTFRQFLPPGTEHTWLYIVHNRYVLIAAETGLTGLAAFVFFLVTALTQRVATARRHHQDKHIPAIALGCTAGLIAIAWDMYWYTSSSLAVDALLWTLTGLLCALHQLPTRNRPTPLTAPRRPAT